MKNLLKNFTLFIFTWALVPVSHVFAEESFSSFFAEELKGCSYEEFGSSFTLIPQSQGVFTCLGRKFETGLFTLLDVIVYIKYLTELVLVITASAAVVMIILGGYKYILSYAVEDKDEGKQRITNALIGLTVSILAWVIINSVLFVIT